MQNVINYTKHHSEKAMHTPEQNLSFLPTGENIAQLSSPIQLKAVENY